ncbi:MAG: phospho-sugar mutase [Clostridia bacterium]
MNKIYDKTQQAYFDWCNNPYYDVATREELHNLMDSNDIEDRFCCDLCFGTGGLRGIMGAGTNRINTYTIRKVAYGIASYVLDLYPIGASVVVAFDTRLHSHEYASEIAAVLSAHNIAVHLFGEPVPTPLLSFATWHLGASAGIMITASHNPKEYNGIKIYDADGVQLVPTKVTEAIKWIQTVDACPPAASPVSMLIVPVCTSIFSDFLQSVLTQSRNRLHNAALNVVYTPLHGAGLSLITKILQMDGITHVTVVPEQREPNGYFPTVPTPNPEDPHALELAIQMGISSGADIVLGTDADSDRLGIGVLHNGAFQLLTGNQIGALLLHFLLEFEPSGQLPGAMLIKTIVTGALGTEIATHHGIQVIETPVGFKYIGEQVVKCLACSNNRFLMAYEESFGFLVGTHARDKDAVVAAMLICEATAYWKAQRKTLIDVLNELYAQYGYFLDALQTFTCPGSLGAEEIQSAMLTLRTLGMEVYPGCIQVIDYLCASDSFPAENVLKWLLPDGSWFAARPSGTEPKIKFYFSIRGQNEVDAVQRLDSLKTALFAHLNH